MKLADLARIAGFASPESGDAEVEGLAMDSRRVAPGDLFVCTPGMRTNPEVFLASVAESGAVAALVHTEVGEAEARRLGLAVLRGPTDRAEFNLRVVELATVLFRSRLAGQRRVAVTGTNGKTTTAWLVRELLEALGSSCAYVGTLGYRRPGRTAEVENTTPFPVDVFNWWVDAASAGVRNVAMEVSSHGLAENRVVGSLFEVGVFTNLTQDHLDFHGSMEAYEAAKWRLFEPPFGQGPQIAIVNVDDPTGRDWAKRLGDRAITFGSAADLAVRSIDAGVSSLEFDLTFKGQNRRVVAPLGSLFNVPNLVGAIGAAVGLGYPFADVVDAARTVRSAPGRFEPIPNDSGVFVLVDYAHTPDALEKLLDSVHAVAKGRVATVFGCGGDRDRTKRPQMARSASERSDLTIVTSDNPRTEDPEAIIDEVVQGVAPGRRFLRLVDRREAIMEAIAWAQPGDVVVLAGKGHEDYQIVGRDKIHLSDYEIAREALKS